MTIYNTPRKNAPPGNMVIVRFCVEADELQPGDSIQVVGSCEDLGLWDPAHALMLTPDQENPKRWTGFIETSEETIKFRYFISYMLTGDEGDRMVISLWESFLLPRCVLTRVEQKDGECRNSQTDLFGFYAGRRLVSEGWLQHEEENQILLRVHGNSLKYYKKGQTGAGRLRVTPLDVRRRTAFSGTVDDDEHEEEDIEHYNYDSHSSTTVGNLSSSTPQFASQPADGCMFLNGSDYLVFKTHSVAVEHLAFYIEVIDADGKKASCYALPSSLNDTFGLTSLPFITKSGRPVGQLSVEYLFVRSLHRPHPRQTMETSFSRHWKKRTTLEVGHRGMGNSYTKFAAARENTIHSLNSAAENGADFVEFDVQLTKDKVAVIYHDFHVLVSVAKRVPEMVDLSLLDDHADSSLNYHEMAVKDLKLKQCKLLMLDHCAVSRPKSDVEVKKLVGDSCEADDLKPFPTLLEALNKVNSDVGFNVEVKYPMMQNSAQMLAQDSHHHSVAHGSQLSLASKHSSTSGLSNSAEYQEHYLLRLAQASPTSASLQHDPHMSDSVSSVVSVDSIFTADGVSLSTPEMPRKTTAAGPLDRAKTSSAFLRTGSSRMSVPSITLSDKSRDDVLTTAHWQQSMQQLERKNMYILGEKGQLKTLRVDKQVELIPVTYPSTHQIKVSFKKLLRVMQPGYAHHENTAANFHRLLDDTEWFDMVSSLLSLSNSVAQLMQLHNSTVVLCLEDGWDATCQISSLVQLLLDPYYRTLEGFQVLVEKEWLAFGHRFSYRANHTIGSQHSGAAPVFLLFLDAVHQLLHQHPSSFQFSHFYLRFLAFHSQAAFFRTFILDSEQERVRLDSLAGDAPATSHHTSIWHFINERSIKTPLFHNLLYNKTDEVLSVVSSPAALQLWQFYSEDRTAHGSPYDIEVAELELQQREEERRARRENSTEWRQTRTQMDDTVCECVRDMCGEGRMERLVQEMQQLAEPVDWQALWTQAEHKLDAQTNRCEDILPAWDRRQQKAVNRRAAIRLLLRGVASNASLRQSKSTGHNFAYHTSSDEEKCAQCRLSLFGTVIKTGWKCRNCGVMVHEKCMQYVLTACRPTPDALRGSTLTALQPAAPPRPPLPIGTIESQKSDTQTLLPASVCAPPARAIPSHQGWLNKKGATFKMWKPRWFVLDSNAHRLVYYDEPQSDAVRGVIDLCDVINVEVDMQQTHAFRKGTALLELRTTKRQYALMAESRHDADVWKEKIEATLRE